MLGQWSAEGGTNITFKMDYILVKTHYSIVPLLQYSMIEAKARASKNTLYFQPIVEIPRRQVRRDTHLSGR
jgi:hypothetical protein